MTLGWPSGTSLAGISTTHRLNHSLLPLPPLSPTRVPSFAPHHLLNTSIHFAEQSPSAALPMDALTYMLILISSEGFDHMKEPYQRPQHSLGMRFPKSPLLSCVLLWGNESTCWVAYAQPPSKPTPCSKKPSNPPAAFSFLSLHPVSPLVPPSNLRCLHQTPS